MEQRANSCMSEYPMKSCLLNVITPCDVEGKMPITEVISMSRGLKSCHTSENDSEAQYGIEGLLVSNGLLESHISCYRRFDHLNL